MAGKAYRGRVWRAVRDLVLDRDGWVCGICGGRIDRHARPGTDRAGTADHVVPVSAGGAWHDPDNLRAAHIGCNRRRGDGTTAARVTYPTRPAW